jgi:hypothetical protein
VGEDDEEVASSIGLSAEEGLSAETESTGMLARVGEAEEGLESAPKPFGEEINLRPKTAS